MDCFSVAWMRPTKEFTDTLKAIGSPFYEKLRGLYERLDFGLSWVKRVQRFSSSMPLRSVWQAHADGKFLAAWPLMLLFFYYGHYEVTVSFIWVNRHHMKATHACCYTGTEVIIHSFERRRAISSIKKCSCSSTHVLPCAMCHHVLQFDPAYTSQSRWALHTIEARRTRCYSRGFPGRNSRKIALFEAVTSDGKPRSLCKSSIYCSPTYVQKLHSGPLH